MSLKKNSRLISLCLCLTLFLSLAGCMKDSGTEKTDEPAEQGSFAEKSLPLPEGMSYATAQCLLGDRVFTGGMGSDAPAAGIVELENGETNPISLPDKIGYIYALCADGDCAAMLCGDPPETYYDAGGQVVNNPNAEGKLAILRYTPDGELVGDTGLSETYTESFILMVSCGNGYVLLSPDALVGIDASGNETGRVNREDGLLFSSMCYDGEELIVCRSELGKPKSEICSLNTDSFRLKALTKIEGMISGLGVWTDNRLLISDRLSKSVKLLDMATGETEHVFFLYELSLDNEHVQSLTVCDRGLLLFRHGQEDIALVLPETPDGKDGPTELILATDSVFSPLTLLVNKFNSENSEYKIKIKSYENSDGVVGMELLATELMAGKAPDIFVFDHSNPFPEDSGYFEDLLPWLDRDGEYGRESIVPGLFNALTRQGTMYCLPYEFDVSVFACSASALNGKTSFTFDELRELSGSLGPDMTLFDNWRTKSEIRALLSDVVLEGFLDREAGECSFDSPDFVSFLKLCNEGKSDGGKSMYEVGIEDDGRERLLGWFPLQTLHIFNGLRATYGDDYCIVKVTQGNADNLAFSPHWSFYMSSQSAHKEGVWEFIRSTLDPDAPRNEMCVFLCSTQAAFQNQVDAALAEELVDMNGEPIFEQSDVDKLNALLNETKYIEDRNNPIHKIIFEETGAYFAGDRTAEETARIIQSRASIYVAERR